jgi:hypothetical protein
MAETPVVSKPHHRPAERIDSPPQQSIEASALLTERLDHLSRKAGVVATIVLDRLTGNVLQKNSGSASKSPFTENQLSHTPKDETTSSTPSQKDADEFATMVWKFVSSAGVLVHDLDAEVCGGQSSS